MKKVYLLLFAMLTFCFMQNGIAQVPYATYDINSRTITIGYADELPEGAFDLSTPEKDGINLAENEGLSKYYAVYFAKSIVIDKSFANFKPTSCENWFAYFGGESITGLENINTENVTDMSKMFLGCAELKTLDLSSFDTKKVTDMSDMFSNCFNLETIFVSDKWDISNIEKSDDEYDYTVLFKENYKLRGGKGTLYESEYDHKPNYKYAVIDGGNNAPGLLTKKGDPLLKGVQPYAVFKNGTLTLYYDDKHNANSIALPHWNSVAEDVKKVVFDKSFAKYKPKTTAHWFEEFVNVTEFSGIENLKTEEVKDMTAMFKNCLSLTAIDLSGFDTKNVAYLGELFFGCINLTTIFVLDKWTTEKAEAMNIKEMEIETLDGNGTETVKVVESGLSSLFQYCFKLCGSKGTKFVFPDECEAYYFIGEEHKYAKIDGGFSAPGVFTRKGEKPMVLNTIAYGKRPYVVFDNGVLTFYCNDKLPQNACTNYFSLVGYSCNPFAHHVTKVVFDESFGDYYTTSCDYWFNDFINLKEIVNLQYLNTSTVTSMKSMFTGCPSLKTLDLSSFDTKNVRSMEYMFNACYSLTTIYVSDKWTTLSVANYSYASPMFEGCVNLVGGNGTKYKKAYYRDYTQGCAYAKIDGGFGDGGYFTKKE